jgi:AraC-like DNA-binding protein/TolB-like protein/Tfp pilus assembly protein PilF
LDNLSSTDKQFITLIARIIDENLNEESYSVEALARDAGLSRSMLHRKLKSLTGMSAGDFITEIRLRKAKTLLESDAATISEIAYKVGFADPSYFTKVFKKRYNMLPGDIRKNIIAGTYKPKKEEALPGLGEVRTRKTRTLQYTIIAFLLVTISITGIYYIFGIDKPVDRSIAVLPLQNLTGDPENAFLIDGMQDALIGELGRIESLRVISRTSTLRYRNTDKLMNTIGKELGVNTIVEGSVMEASDSMKLLVQVIDVGSKEGHLMVGEYQEDIKDVLSMQKSAVKDIARKIGVKLSDKVEQRLEKTRTVNPETYKLYLKGMYYINHGSPESFEEGIRYMLKAIDTDPGDPLAYAGLALGYAIKGHGMVAPESSFRSAYAAAEKALQIDPTLDEAYTALALINSYYKWDWSKISEDFEKALAHNPNNSVAHAHFAYINALLNNKEKAYYHAEMAIELEPYSAAYFTYYAWTLYYYGNFKEAEKYARKALELEEDIPYGNLVLGWTYIKKKQFNKALELHKKLPDYADYSKMLIGYTYIQAGKKEQAMELLARMETDAGEKFVNPVFRGLLAGMLGDKDRAFELLNEACDQKMYPIIFIKLYPGIEYIKDDPRYAELLQKMNLPI